MSKVAIPAVSCDTCAYYTFDEDYDGWVCGNDIDEDDYSRLLETNFKSCPYYKNGDEYQVVKHQI